MSSPGTLPLSIVPQEAWGVFRSSRIAIFGGPNCIQMIEGSKWGNENRLARGTRNRLAAGDKFPSGQILPEVQWRLDTLLSASGYSAQRPALGSNPANAVGFGEATRFDWGEMAMGICWFLRTPRCRDKSPNGGSRA